MAELPFIGQKHWGAQLNEVIKARTGNVPIFGSQAEALAWENDHPGGTALWFDAEYTEVTASGPIWEDAPITGGGSWTTPTEPGVYYSPASGTATPGQTVTVNATARTGYTLTGTSSWTHTFPQSSDTLFTDFTDAPLDQVPPGWTPRWVVPTINGWRVQAASSATGGVALRHSASLNERRLLSWDVVNDLDATDVEIVFKWATSNANNPAHGIIRAAGTPGAETGYRGAVINASKQGMSAFLAGQSVIPLGPEAPFTSQVHPAWFITRFRVEGAQLSAKTWPADEAEPSAWTVTTTDDRITAEGWVGLFAFGAGGFWFDWVGVAVNGKTAPKGA